MYINLALKLRQSFFKTIGMEILLPKGERGKLAAEFNVSMVTIWKALTGKSNSEKARMIRKAAMERGGQIYNTSREK